MKGIVAIKYNREDNEIEILTDGTYISPSVIWGYLENIFEHGELLKALIKSIIYGGWYSVPK